MTFSFGVDKQCSTQFFVRDDKRALSSLGFDFSFFPPWHRCIKSRLLKDYGGFETEGFSSKTVLVKVGFKN